ncbi:3-oxo-5-alpha-steroid 4-dehydrogenase-domain-containing protein [Dipodascopsis tothii]|uniref:3-oxo-5-alpha-steroid 4-dehydrogenase-domain-containing protein n=1 Tax=Dipodascopsis tothii TaxID=44089 RepID=UPI0034CF832F
MVEIALKSKGKGGRSLSKLPSTLDVQPTQSVEDLYQKIGRLTGLGKDRLRLTLIDNTVLADGYDLEKYDLQKGSTVFVKDLGYQIAWRTVFLIEYFGPLIIHPFFYYLQKPIYGKEFEHTREQQTVLCFVLLHFIKREYESAFVHRFSNATMPLKNIFKNSGHYWLISGFNIAYWVYRPDSRPSIPDGIYYVASALWVYAEVSNYITHINLASLRPAGTKERKIPHGYGFNWVSCPNYFFEILGWFAICIISRSLSSVIFLIVSAVTMWAWAVKKHKRYRRDFAGKYPKNRKVLFPFLA